MAASSFRTTQLLSHQFVNCAGSILFRHLPNQPLQICFLHYRTKDEWLLPKGRQDLGESLAHAALRETFEETGYPCRLLPVNMLTRATESGVDAKDHPRFVNGCTEPFTVSIRHVSEKDVKFIWWFITVVPDVGGEKRENTQMQSENFESVFCDVGLGGDIEDDATWDTTVARLTFANDREVAKNALKLVAISYPQWFSSAKPPSEVMLTYSVELLECVLNQPARHDSYRSRSYPPLKESSNSQIPPFTYANDDRQALHDLQVNLHLPTTSTERRTKCRLA